MDKENSNDKIENLANMMMEINMMMEKEKPVPFTQEAKDMIGEIGIAVLSLRLALIEKGICTEEELERFFKQAVSEIYTS